MSLNNQNMKYIIVTGGVISSIGKGVLSSSIGTILKQWGMEVTAIKIDPYINIDAGTFSPYEHGEVFVLDDGGEVDVDLGNYERFLDVTLRRENNITTGKIYKSVIEKERKGEYLGKTVQVIPHITDEIQDTIERVAQCGQQGKSPQVCIIELGGTIGDIEGMPFIEAFRQFQFRAKKENVCFIHVSLVPELGCIEEHKTKPTQNSIRQFRSSGLNPDLIVCRSETPIGRTVKEKISSFCHVSTEKVICLHTASCIYNVPLMLESQNFSRIINEQLNLGIPQEKPSNFMCKWIDLVKKTENLREEVAIALVGKYTAKKESYVSVEKSLRHAALYCNRKLNLSYIDAEDLEDDSMGEPKYFAAWKIISECNGIIVPGGFGVRGMEGKIGVCNYARRRGLPFLGVCLGMQASVIEFSRNVLGIKDASSKEMEPEKDNHVIIDMPEHNGEQKGGTMRLGSKRTNFKAGVYSKVKMLYEAFNENTNRDGNKELTYIHERHRHRFEVNPGYVEKLEEAGMNFIGHDLTEKRMEIVEIGTHPYYVGVQYHPEYLSRPLKPSPPYVGLILASCKKLEEFISNEGKLSSEYNERKKSCNCP